MRTQNWLRAAIVVAAAFPLACAPAFGRRQEQSSSSGSTASQQTGDSLADAARKAREKQKAQPKAKKVYTEDDIPARLGGDTAGTTPNGTQASAKTDQSTAGAATTGTQAGAGAAGTTGADDPEKVWRKRFQAQRDKIASAERELDVLQREMDKAQTQYYSDPTKAMNEQNSRSDINDRNAKIAQKKDEIANLKQQLSDMELELRRSGGDPGWARE